MSTLNVMSFGAVGNGIADDTAAVQSALDAATSGDIVFFPAGTYLVDLLTYPISNLTMLGVGNTSIIVKTINGTAISMIIANGKTNCRIELIQLNGRGSSQSYWVPNPYAATDDASNVRFIGGTGHSMVDVYSHDAVWAGVMAQNCPGIVITRVTGANNVFGTVAVYDVSGAGSDNAIVTDCTADQDYCDGIRVSGSDNVIVTGCTSTNARFVPAAPAQFGGIFLENLTNCTVSNCIMHGNSSRGVDSAPDAINCPLLNNTIFDHPNDAILTGASGFLVLGNRCTDNGSNGIVVYGTGHFLKNNACHDQATGIGQSGGGAFNTTLVNNDCRGNSGESVSSALRSSSGFSETGTLEDTDTFSGVIGNNGCAMAATG